MIKKQFVKAKTLQGTYTWCLPESVIELKERIDNLNIQNGEGEGSLEQFRNESKAYQKFSLALGGACQAGNKYGDPDYYSFSIAGGERTVARGRSTIAVGADLNIAPLTFHSAAFNQRNVIHHNNCGEFGTGNVTKRDNQFVVGTFNGQENDGSIFQVGNGEEYDKSNFSKADDLVGYYYFDAESMRPVIITNDNKQEVFNNPNITLIQKRSNILTASTGSVGIKGSGFAKKLQVGDASNNRLPYTDFAVVGGTELRGDTSITGKVNITGVTQTYAGMQIGYDQTGNRLNDETKFAVIGGAEIRGKANIRGNTEFASDVLVYGKMKCEQAPTADDDVVRLKDLKVKTHVLDFTWVEGDDGSVASYPATISQQKIYELMSDIYDNCIVLLAPKDEIYGAPIQFHHDGVSTPWLTTIDSNRNIWQITYTYKYDPSTDTEYFEASYTILKQPKLYRHNIECVFNFGNAVVRFNVLNSKSSQMSRSEILEYINTRGIKIACTGYVTMNGVIEPCFGIRQDNNDEYAIAGLTDGIIHQLKDYDEFKDDVEQIM